MAAKAQSEKPHDLNCLAIEELRELAAERMNKQTRDYYNEGVDSGSTLLENIQAYKRHHVARTAMQCVAHPDGELATARACRKAGIPMSSSSFATSNLEDVASASGFNPLILQLYLSEERTHSPKLIARAKAAGYKAGFPTVDTPMLGPQESSSDTGASIMNDRPSSESANDEKQKDSGSAPGFHDGETRRAPQGPITFHMHAVNPTLTWDRDIEWLKKECGPDMQVWLEGIATAEESLLALHHRVDGIVVSNHGGCQSNGALATLDALPDIVQAAAGKMPVHGDGSIRHGTDVFKALALGADFV